MLDRARDELGELLRRDLRHGLTLLAELLAEARDAEAPAHIDVVDVLEPLAQVERARRRVLSPGLDDGADGVGLGRDRGSDEGTAESLPRSAGVDDEPVDVQRSVDEA